MSRYRNAGDILDWHPGKPGRHGVEGVDHWHHYPAGKGPRYRPVFPGDEIPDPDPAATSTAVGAGESAPAAPRLRLRADLWRPEGLRLVQLHDSTLVALHARAGGQVIVCFAGVSAYYSVTPERDDVWVHGARLQVEDATSVTIHGCWTRGDDDYIAEDEVVNSSGEEIAWVRLQDEQLQGMRFILPTGAFIEITCTRAALSLSKSRELVGQWADGRLHYASRA